MLFCWYAGVGQMFKTLLMKAIPLINDSFSPTKHFNVRGISKWISHLPSMSFNFTPVDLIALFCFHVVPHSQCSLLAWLSYCRRQELAQGHVLMQCIRTTTAFCHLCLELGLFAGFPIDCNHCYEDGFFLMTALYSIVYWRRWTHDTSRNRGVLYSLLRSGWHKYMYIL